MSGDILIVRTRGMGATGIWWIGTNGAAAKHAQDSPPQQRLYLAQNVNSGEVGKPCIIVARWWQLLGQEPTLYLVSYGEHSRVRRFRI